MAHTAAQWPIRLLRAIDEHFWLRHGLFWLVRTVYMTWQFLYDLHTTADWQVALRDSLILLPPQLVATYSLLYGVLPLLWRPKRRGLFLALLALWLVGTLALTFAYRFFVFIPAHQGAHTSFTDYNVVFAHGSHLPLLLLAGVAACLHVYRQWHQKELLNGQIKQENAQAELQLLKAQVHPHFLFNTLNNLYALTLRQSDEAPIVVERLASLLFFVVEQGNASSIALADEVALLRNYIALEQLRYGSRLTVDFQVQDLSGTARITPLLLLPLVENAFKHGSAEQLGQASIHLTLNMVGDNLYFVVANTKNLGSDTHAKSAGIGLQNVRQRLQLLYPQHHFEIEAHDETFTVRLMLRLSTHVELAHPPSAERSDLPADDSHTPDAVHLPLATALRS
ncbi:sensor histidine kinase [Hymenobacter sp. GOD-10R]|uniref:sensor histidine kinase n=1 Tax=Hymenobacter sp. GOD-10R TaxID=3093922 RepID=UPI002D77EB4B|nr:histidine kinase [Hymenobacter sp. GOD-10R]WRQ27708.1 histidine kinase [Hymenobacter sp. GOD-10R]